MQFCHASSHSCSQCEVQRKIIVPGILFSIVMTKENLMAQRDGLCAKIPKYFVSSLEVRHTIRDLSEHLTHHVTTFASALIHPN